jgi:hypothetical protein
VQLKHDGLQYAGGQRSFVGQGGHALQMALQAAPGPLVPAGHLAWQMFTQFGVPPDDEWKQAGEHAV